MPPALETAMPIVQPRTNFGKYDKFITSCIIAQASNESGQIAPWADLAETVQIFTVEDYYFFFAVPVPPHW